MLVAALAILGLLLAHGAASHVSSYQIPQYYKIHEEDDKPWVQKLIDDPIALFTLILTISTFGLYLATRALWNSTEKLVFGAEKTAAMQLRAYIGVKLAQVSERDGQGNPLELTIIIQNFGNTPATHYSVRVGWLDERRAFDLTPAHLPQRGNPSTLMPGQSDEISLWQARPPVSFGVVFGKIEFIDAFGEMRFTDFRYKSRLGSDRFTPDVRGNASN